MRPANRERATADDAILDEWADFPVAESPRPVVLLDQRLRVGDAGFVDSDTKMAFLEGAVESMVALPAGVLDLFTKNRRPSTTTPIKIVGLEAVSAPFRTDRGLRQLPAFRIVLTGTRQPCIVLNPQTNIWWPRDGKPLPDLPAGGISAMVTGALSLPLGNRVLIGKQGIPFAVTAG